MAEHDSNKIEKNISTPAKCEQPFSANRVARGWGFASHRGLTPASTPLGGRQKDVDARIKSGQSVLEVLSDPPIPNPALSVGLNRTAMEPARDPSERDISDHFLAPVLTPPLGRRFFGRGHTMRLRQYVVRAAALQSMCQQGSPRSPAK
jgi:hypothetical protein